MTPKEFLARASFFTAAGLALYAGINSGVPRVNAADIPLPVPVSSPTPDLSTMLPPALIETTAPSVILALSNENALALEEKARVDAMIHSFPQSVYYWYDNGSMDRWHELYNVDYADMATLMTIESLGNPLATSRDRDGNPIARGLFQVVWKWHSKPTDPGPDILYDPDISAERGLTFFRQLVDATGDLGEAYKRYNGGNAVAWQDHDQLPDQTNRYWIWSGISVEARAGMKMKILQEFLKQAASMCREAERVLELTPSCP